MGQRQAIVDATAGTTRDRHYGKTDWNGKEFSVIDTGGYAVNSDDIFEDDIRRQVMLAIEEADLILFMVEVNTGITDLDMMMADVLRRSRKRVIVVCNKVDNYDLIYLSHEFYAMGLGDPYRISSMSGSGTGDLMDAILAAPPEDTRAEGGGRPAAHNHRGTSQRRQVVDDQRPAGRGAQHRDRHRRHHARLDPHAVQQVRHGLLPGRYGRHVKRDARWRTLSSTR